MQLPGLIVDIKRDTVKQKVERGSLKDTRHEKKDQHMLQNVLIYPYSKPSFELN